MVGYTTYVRLIDDLVSDKETIATGMTREVERCRAALDRVLQGQTAALVSSGDPGVYGMAGLALEMIAAEQMDVDIEIVPGVTAANAAAAVVGAPLVCDYAVISLSDLLIPWDTIEKRIGAALDGDFVIVVYNPKSKKRTWQIERLVEMALERRPADTPVAVVSHVGSENQTAQLSHLADLLSIDIGMRSTVIIGNSSTARIEDWLVTARGYEL